MSPKYENMCENLLEFVICGAKFWQDPHLSRYHCLHYEINKTAVFFLLVLPCHCVGRPAYGHMFMLYPTMSVSNYYHLIQSHVQPLHLNHSPVANSHPESSFMY